MGTLLGKYTARWEYMLELYVAFKQEFGREPVATAVYGGENLGAWCKVQRALGSNGELTDRRLQQLTAAGFDFTSRAEKDAAQWEYMLGLYVAFKQEFGREPSQKEVYEDVNLGTWYTRQKSFLSHGKLPDERAQKLVAAGLNPGSRWASRDARWEFMLELYVAFKQEYGREPVATVVYGGENLGYWCRVQKTLGSKGELADGRLQKLTAAGFDFTSQADKEAAQWESMLELYVSFKQEFGREPFSSEVYKGEPIGSWCLTQRSLYGSGKLSDGRIQKLTDAGFDFIPRSEKDAARWEFMFGLYKEFKQEFGREPSSTEDYKGVCLGRWCRTQRTAYGNGALSAERQQKLIDAGFDFTDKLDARWEYMFGLFVAFKQEFGREPVASDVYEGAEIGRWYYTQKSAYAKGRLSDERLQKLTAAGISFSSYHYQSHDSRWEDMFGLYVRYKKEFGREPVSSTVYREENLGAWCQTQKGVYSKGELSDERHDRLLEVGFPFKKVEGELVGNVSGLIAAAEERVSVVACDALEQEFVQC